MNFGEAVDNIATRLKRPDKILDVQDAINRAISVFTTATFFADLLELQVALVSTTYTQSLDITANPFTRFRKIKYIRPTGYRRYITWMDPSRIWMNNCENVNVWYRAGNNIQFKLSALQSTAEIGYYKYPVVMDDDADTNWMLDQMFPAVQSYALCELFREIGNDADGDRYERRWQGLLATYKEDLGDGASYG